MNLSTMVVFLILFGMILLALQKLFRDKKTGKTGSCGGDCSHCGFECDHIKKKNEL